jgi:hypothetical protein
MKRIFAVLAAMALLFFYTPAMAGALLNGAGVPSAAIGADGDFYVDTVTMLLHGPKTGGNWPAVERPYQYKIETMTNVPAADADRLVDAEETVDGALTLTETPQLFPRNLTYAITDADTSIDAFTLVLVGTDQFNQPITDTFVFADGLTGSTTQAYMTLTSATLSDMNGATETDDVIDIGTGVLLGLNQSLGDAGVDTGVYRFLVGTTITTIPAIDTDANTIDLTDSAPNGTNDYTIYMKALR